jgi:signal transduction histidine kinase
VAWGLLAFIALLPVGILGIYAYRITSRSVRQVTVRGNGLAARMATEVVSREFASSMRLVAAFSRSPNLVEAVKRHDEQAVRKQLRIALEPFPNIDRISVLDLQGMSWSDYPKSSAFLGKNYSARDYFRGVKRGWKPYVSEVFYREATPRMMVVAVAAPIRDAGGTILGVIQFHYRLESLTEWLKDCLLDYDGFVFVIDHSGHVAAHPRLDLTMESHREYAALEPARKALRGEPSALEYEDPVAAQTMIATFLPVEISGNHWVVVAQQSAAKAYAPIRRLGLQLGAATILLALVAFAVVAVLGRLQGAAAEAASRAKMGESLRLEDARKEALLQLNQMAKASMQEICTFTLEAAVRLTRSKIGYLAFLNDDETVLTMHSWSKTAMAQCAIIDKPIIYPVVTTGLWGEAVRQRKPVITNDYQAPNPLKKGHPEGHVKVLRHMNAPVFDGERIVIVAGVGNKEAPYDESDVRQVTLLMQGMWQLLQRRQAEESLSRYARQLEVANRELEAFSYSASHDLRTPLRSLDGFSLALIEDLGDKLEDSAKDYLNRIRAASQRMGTLIDDLLKLSRVTRHELDRRSVDLSRLAHAVERELRNVEPARNVEFIIEDGLAGEGDEHLLRMVIQQLLENAWKFTGRQPRARIEFGHTVSEGRTVYLVRDNGVGFDMAYADNLFGAFQRLHAAAEFPGSGIGLATVQRIVHRHGGRIWAEAALEKGATFYFTL